MTKIYSDEENKQMQRIFDKVCEVNRETTNTISFEYGTTLTQIRAYNGDFGEDCSELILNQSLYSCEEMTRDTADTWIAMLELLRHINRREEFDEEADE